MRSGHVKGGLLVAEASGQLSCLVRVLVAVDVLTTPVVSGGRALTVRTRGVNLPRAVSRGIIGCLLPLLVEGLLFTGARINVPVEAHLLQTRGSSSKALILSLKVLRSTS
jgi:hypothetical protein